MNTKREKREVKVLEGIASYAFLTKAKPANEEYSISERWIVDLIITDPKVASHLKEANFNIKTLTKEGAPKGSGLEQYVGKAKLACYRNTTWHDKKTGESGINKPPVIKDSQNNVITKIMHDGHEVMIGNGSKIRVAYTESKQKGVDGWVRANLIGVQILSLVPYVAASAANFDKVEGGYIAQETAEADEFAESWDGGDTRNEF